MKNKMVKQNIILKILIAVVCLMLASSIVLAGAPPSAPKEGSSGDASSTSGMVTLFSGQLISEPYLTEHSDVFFDVDKCDGDNKDCWDVSGSKVVFYDDKENKITKDTDKGYHGGLTYDGGYFTDSEGGSYTKNGQFNIHNGDIYVPSPGGLYDDDPVATLPSGVKTKDVDGLTLLGSEDKTEIAILVNPDDGSEGTVYVGETELTRSEYEGFKDKFTLGVESTADGELTYYDDKDKKGTIKIDHKTTYTEITHTTPSKETTNEREYNDGTTVQTTAAGITTVALEDGTSVSGEAITTDGSIRIVDGETTILITDSSETLSIKKSIGSEEIMIYDVIFDDKGNKESSLTQNYDLEKDGTYRITSDSGSVGKAEFDTTYTSSTDKETEVVSYSAERTYNDEFGSPVAIQSSVPTGPQEEIDESAPIYIVVEAEGEDGKTETHYGTVTAATLRSKGAGEITAADIGEVDPENPKHKKGFEDLALAQKKHRQQESWDNIKTNSLGVLENGAIGKFTGLSNLFFKATDNEQWVRNVDAWWSRNVLNQDAWVSNICYATTFERSLDLQADGVAIIENSAGNIQTVANIFAEMTYSDALLCVRNTDESVEEEYICPVGLFCADNGLCYNEETEEQAEGYFYKISWGVQAPADEAATPNSNEDGFAVEYNIVAAGNRLYIGETGDSHPLKLINGDKDGQVITWWSNNNYEGSKVCVDWSGDTDIYTTGGSAGFGFKPGIPIDDVCNKIVYSQQTTVSMNSIGTTGSYDASSDSEQSTTTSDVSFNTDW